MKSMTSGVHQDIQITNSRQARELEKAIDSGVVTGHLVLTGFDLARGFYTLCADLRVSTSDNRPFLRI